MTLTHHQTIANMLATLKRLHGEPFVLFTDGRWVSGPAGHIDLFQRFSDVTGQSIGLVEGVRGIEPLFFIPAARVQAFIRFITTVRIPLPSGAAVQANYSRSRDGHSIGFRVVNIESRN